MKSNLYRKWKNYWNLSNKQRKDLKKIVIKSSIRLWDSPGGALRKIRRLAPGRETHAGADPPPCRQSGLPARSAPGRAVLTRTGAGIGRTGKAVEDAPARREHHAGRWTCHPAGSRPRPGPAGAELCLLGRHRPLSGAGKGRSGC